MDIHDADRIALLPVGRGEEQAPDQAEGGQHPARPKQPRQNRAGQPQELARIGEPMQRLPRTGRRDR